LLSVFLPKAVRKVAKLASEILKTAIMGTSTFTQNLLGMQAELRRFAMKLTADYEEANDLLQETSLKALDNEDKYTPDTNFKGWMYTIMRNIFINNYRKTVRDQTFIDQTDNLFHLNLPQDSGFESTEGNYDLKEIRKIVHSLPKEYRVPFSMYVSGFKYREIADKLGLPLGTVKSRIFFTRQRLQKELKDFR
jgi:RNA polymerase sigma-70 factor (ECF subfamily)